nr:hypothetical protein [Tanacetum cinerariifolium]
ELAEYDKSTSTDHPIFLNDNEDHPVQNIESPENSSEENVVLKTNQEPPQNSDIHQLIDELNQQTSVVTTAMTAILKHFQATPPLASVKDIEKIYVTCGGAHPYYQCLAADGNTFSEFQDNIQGYVSVAAVNYNQGKSSYRPLSVANQIRPLGFAQPNMQNNQNRFSQPQGYYRGNNFNQDTSYQAPIQQNQVVPLTFFQINTASTLGLGPLLSNTIANPKGELKAITTQIGLVLNGIYVPMPTPFINPKEDEHAEETLTGLELAEYTIKVPPPLVQKAKPPSLRNYVGLRGLPRWNEVVFWGVNNSWTLVLVRKKVNSSGVLFTWREGECARFKFQPWINYFAKNFMLHVPPESNEFEGDIIP